MSDTNDDDERPGHDKRDAYADPTPDHYPGGLTANDREGVPEEDLRSNASSGEDPRSNADFDMGLRLGIAAELGHSGFDDRDRYDVFGWETDPDDDELLGLYLRNGYARTVVDKPAKTTWRDPPTITDGADDSEFVDAVSRLADATRMWSYAQRVDRVAGVGEHGLLVINYSDVTDPNDMQDAVSLSDPSLDDVQGFRVFYQAQIDNVEHGGPGSERWGLPEEYTIDLNEDVDDDPEDDRTGSIKVHHSRVVDVPAQSLLEDETKSRPRIEPVLNQLYDIEKVLGATAEAAYRGADYGLALKQDPEKVDTGAQAQGDLREELERYEQGLQRYLRLVGTDVERLGGEVADPTGIIESEVSVIAAVTGIPKRMLTGEAAGEIASSETDMRQWFGQIAERREQYAGPHIVRPLLEALIEQDVLPTPNKGDFQLEWPDLFELNDEEKADVQETRAKVVKNAQTAVPDLRGERAEQYIETGRFPDRDDSAGGTSDVLGNEFDEVDEDDAAVQGQFDEQFGGDGDE